MRLLKSSEKEVGEVDDWKVIAGIHFEGEVGDAMRGGL